MTNDNIKRRIKELYQEALEEAGYSIEEMKLLIMRKLTGIVLTDTADIARVVYADDERRKAALAQLADANGGQGVIDFGAPMVYIRPTAEWTPDERAAVKSIAMDKYGIRVETYDKTTALKTLAEITGIVRSGVDVNLSIADGIEEARQRAAGTGEAGAE
jgi:hypothetical protein